MNAACCALAPLAQLVCMSSYLRISALAFAFRRPILASLRLLSNTRASADTQVAASQPAQHHASSKHASVNTMCSSSIVISHRIASQQTLFASRLCCCTASTSSRCSVNSRSFMLTPLLTCSCLLLTCCVCLRCVVVVVPGHSATIGVDIDINLDLLCIASNSNANAAGTILAFDHDAAADGWQAHAMVVATERESGVDVHEMATDRL